MEADIPPGCRRQTRRSTSSIKFSPQYQTLLRYRLALGDYQYSAKFFRSIQIVQGSNGVKHSLKEVVVYSGEIVVNLVVASVKI